MSAVAVGIIPNPLEQQAQTPERDKVDAIPDSRRVVMHKYCKNRI